MIAIPVRPRVALLMPYWSFFAADAGQDLLPDREQLLASVANAIGTVSDAVVACLVIADVDTDAIVRRIRHFGPDVAVIASTLAAPPAPTLGVLDALGDLPLVVWAVSRSIGLATPFDHAAIVLDGATVGTPMITNTLVRSGRAFDLVVGSLDDPQACSRAADAVVAAGAAARLRHARIARIGNPIPGYSCVDADDARISEDVGVDIVRLPESCFAEAFDAVRGSASERLRDSIDASYDESDVPASQFGDASRAAAALMMICEDHALDAGTLNCHTPAIRLNPSIGFAPCFALGHCTSNGIPWTCTGDVLTSIAMLVTKILTGTALYHELESFDANGEFVIANTGEHDLAFAAGPAKLRTNPWWPTGCNAAITLPPGPATLLALTQLDRGSGHRLVAAQGHFTGRAFPAVGTSNGGFVFASGPAASTWAAWCRAGVSHHAAAASGHIAAQVAAVADHLGIGVRVI